MGWLAARQEGEKEERWERRKGSEKVQIEESQANNVATIPPGYSTLLTVNSSELHQS